jgi:hypothetical protein
VHQSVKLSSILATWKRGRQKSRPLFYLRPALVPAARSGKFILVSSSARDSLARVFLRAIC